MLGTKGYTERRGTKAESSKLLTCENREEDKWPEKDEEIR